MHCPGCGRRFHVKLESKKLLSSHTEKIPSKVVGGMVFRGATVATTPSYIVVQEGKPLIIGHEEFQYAYKCGHCGHEWTETRTKTHRGN